MPFFIFNNLTTTQHNATLCVKVCLLLLDKDHFADPAIFRIKFSETITQTHILPSPTGALRASGENPNWEIRQFSQQLTSPRRHPLCSVTKTTSNASRACAVCDWTEFRQRDPSSAESLPPVLDQIHQPRRPNCVANFFFDYFTILFYRTNDEHFVHIAKRALEDHSWLPIAGQSRLICCTNIRKSNESTERWTTGRIIRHRSWIKRKKLRFLLVNGDRETSRSQLSPVTVNLRTKKSAGDVIS